MMKNQRMFQVLFTMAICIGSTLFAEEESTPLIDEVAGNLKTAAAQLDQFDRIRARVTDLTPVAIDYSSLNEKKERTVADVVAAAKQPTSFAKDRIVTYSIAYLRGVQDTERVEMSPIIRSETREDGENAKAVVSPATVSFTDESGERFVGVHNYMFVKKTGDAGIRKSFARDRNAESRLTPFTRSARFGPGYVYSAKGIPLEAYLRKELSLATTSNREIDADGDLVYTFGIETNGRQVDCRVAFKQFDENWLPLTYSISAEGNIVEEQVWEYQIQDNLWVPQTSTLTFPSGLKDVDTTEVVAFEFEKGDPLDETQLREFFPVEAELQPLFDEGRQLYMARVSKSEGLPVSGNIEEFP